jgi:hypothetical protein
MNPRRVSDMSNVEAAFVEAMHDVDCGEGPVGHPLSDHEPFDLDTAQVPWPTLVSALRRRGLLIVEIDSNERDENPYIRGYNQGWTDALEDPGESDVPAEPRNEIDGGEPWRATLGPKR